MTENSQIPISDRGLVRLQTIAVVCAALTAIIAPYAFMFALKIQINLFTSILYYVLPLLILSFLSMFDIVCAVLLFERKSWRTFAVILGIVAFAVCVFTLVQWITFDMLIKKKMSVSLSWKATFGSIVIAVAAFATGARLLRNAKQKVAVRLLLLLSTLSVTAASISAFQFLPRFQERGSNFGALEHYPAEDMLDTSAPGFSLLTLGAEPYNLEDHRGKVIIMDVWATWCAPCIMQLPNFQKLREDFVKDPVEFLAVSCDADTGRVRPFIDSLGYSFTTLFGTKQMEEAYRISLIPTTFIIDKKGIIRQVHIGYYGKAPESMLRLIRNLRDE